MSQRKLWNYEQVSSEPCAQICRKWAFSCIVPWKTLYLPKPLMVTTVSASEPSTYPLYMDLRRERQDGCQGELTSPRSYRYCSSATCHHKKTWKLGPERTVRTNCCLVLCWVLSSDITRCFKGPPRNASRWIKTPYLERAWVELV